MAGISNSGKDIFSIFNNPALSDYSKRTEFSSNFNLPFGIPDLRELSFCSRLPNKHATIGIGLISSGTQFLNSQGIILSIGRKVENFSFGLSTEFRQLGIYENGNYRGIIFNIGASSSIIPKLEFSMYLSNVNQAGIGLEQRELFESQIKISTRFESSEKLFLYLESDLQLDQEIIIRTAMEYLIIKNMSIRTGFKSNPFSPSFGFSINKKVWSFNQSIDYNQILGFSHCLSIVYAMAGQK